MIFFFQPATFVYKRGKNRWHSYHVFCSLKSHVLAVLTYLFGDWWRVTTVWHLAALSPCCRGDKSLQGLRGQARLRTPPGGLPSQRQQLFLVPLIGGRRYIITQLAVYTTYIPLIYCLLGGLYATYHLLREPGNSIDSGWDCDNIYIYTSR